ncbi:MAG: NAD-binding protein, partial [Dehalococcoidia bacterium]|nr:NAD-binding protein [Dehalococcoidia bacterium]
EAAHIRYARVMVISTTDPVTGLVSAQNALRLNPNLDIVARIHSREVGERLRELGVREVVWPEMEAGLEMLRYSLQSYLTEPGEVDLLVRRLREQVRFGMVSEEMGDLLPPEDPAEGLGLGPETEGPSASEDVDVLSSDGPSSTTELVEQPTDDTSSDTRVSD